MNLLRGAGLPAPRARRPYMGGMHKSRLVAFVIDCQDGDLAAGAGFWSRALGRAVRPDSEDPRYAGLDARPTEPMLLLQKVEHPSRIHLDIETDDVPAEVARLEKLGAKQVGKVRTWVVMEAPSGHRFCVVRPQRGALGDDANVWE